MRILLAGDVMLGRRVNEELKHVDPAYVWGDTLPLFRTADIRACNLECVLSNRGRPWSATPKVFHFRSDAKNVEVLNRAGIGLVSLANNHVLDYEYDALLDMFAILERSGIRWAGAGRNRSEARRPAVLECEGVRVAMIACTDNEPGWEATAGRPGTFYAPPDPAEARAQDLLRSVAEASRMYELVMVSLHWGPNWGYWPPQEHIAFGRALVDSGAGLVFGHSPHVFRGIEMYRGKPIFYSAGNFVDDYAVDEIERNDESFVFVLDAEGGAVREITLYPTVIRRLQARRAGPRRAKDIAAKMEALCRALGTVSRWSMAENCLKIQAPAPAERAA
jgi:poly-gamma-glutamate capsule biosynthesis protein CapA/YwtB (metallophosphatase superfamily)